MSEGLPDSTDLVSYPYSVQNIDSIINLLAIFHAIVGVLTIPIVSAFSTQDIFQAPLFVTVMLIIRGSILAVSMPVFIIIGWAIWRLQPWAWKLSVITNSVCLILYILNGIVVIASLNIIFLFLLFGSDLRLALAPLESQHDTE